MSTTGNNEVDEFFRRYGYLTAIESTWHDVSFEELYQMFKARMLAELSAERVGE